MAYLSEDMKRFNFYSAEIENAYHDAALRLGLSDSTMIVLYSICNSGDECMISEITGMTGIRKQTVNSALRKLESEDIIYLEKSNGRKKKVCLTEKGKDFVKLTVLRLINAENEIFDSWTVEERKIYVELTKRYLLEFREKLQTL
ncbi:MAG: MarR family transcriptional regulator [Ruminococcus sp.]|nr:MarR family transcriptional regulator [Ruminococcus sp.]